MGRSSEYILGNVDINLYFLLERLRKCMYTLNVRLHLCRFAYVLDMIPELLSTRPLPICQPIVIFTKSIVILKVLLLQFPVFF